MASLNDLFKKNSTLFGPTNGYGIVPTRTQNLPNDTGSYQTPSGQPPSLSSVYSGDTSKAVPSLVAAPIAKPIVKKTSSPVPSGQDTVDVSKYINPKTGTIYTQKEYADKIASTLPQNTAQQNGDVPQFAGDTLTQGSQTTEQLQNTASGLNNARNDLAVGESDPYKVGNESGVAYTPAELTAIEKAYAGIYDPAINTALSKLDTKQKEDAAALDSKNQLTLQAQKHKDDLELKRTPSGDSTSGIGSGSNLYVPGQNLTVDAYVNRLNNGDLTEADLIKYLPGVKNTDIRNQITLALNQTRQNSAKSGQNLDIVNNINTLLSNPGASEISGPIDQFLGGYAGTAKDAKTTYNYIKDNLALIKAQTALKGQGQISDFERKILDNASSAISRGQDDESFKNALIQVKGALLSSSGVPTSVEVTDSRGNKTTQSLDTNGIRDAIRNGATIKYIESTSNASTPAPSEPTTTYTIGQIIPGSDGKNYRITGLSDPNDPDVELVK